MKKIRILCGYCKKELGIYPKINMDYPTIDEDTGRVFCCDDCASRQGVYWCLNDGLYHSQYLYVDGYDGNHFRDPDKGWYHALDGTSFYSEEHMHKAGYAVEADGKIRKQEGYGPYSFYDDQWNRYKVNIHDLEY